MHFFTLTTCIVVVMKTCEPVVSSRKISLELNQNIEFIMS